MNYHYRNEKFLPRFMLAIFLSFFLVLGIVAIFADDERHRFESAEKKAEPRIYILLGDDTWITIIGGGRDALVRVSRDGLFE